MQAFLSKFKVHHTRNDIYDTGNSSNGLIPQAYRLAVKDTLYRRRGLDLRNRCSQKAIPRLSYTAPRTDLNYPVKKNELQNSFPSQCLHQNSLPINSLPLTELQQSLTPHPHPVKSRIESVMALYFRFFPEHTRYLRYEFTIGEEANRMLVNVFSSLGLSNMVRFSIPDLFLNTRIRGGLHHLIQEIISSSPSTSTSTRPSTPFKKVIEVLTYYKGMYGRLIILISLGVGCTVWYNFIPGGPEIAPPGILVPRDLNYDSFKNVDFNVDPFRKLSYVEYKYITDQVLSALENVYPFSEIALPNEPDTRVAIGLGLIIAVFLSMGMMSYSSGLITR